MADDFRTLLRRHRDRRRWSQLRCAVECEMDHSLVSRLERGQRAPTRETLAKLYAGLGISTGDADDLWLAAGFLPPTLPMEALREALVLVRTTMSGEVAAARQLIGEARRLAS